MADRCWQRPERDEDIVLKGLDSMLAVTGSLRSVFRGGKQIRCGADGSRCQQGKDRAWRSSETEREGQGWREPWRGGNDL